ncbi:MAG TPA: PAS domain-containing protein [Candidatus Angelobacter sp.]|nr:PAS domain-containing protein [Candidatus Sulfotelmatobacter sp.]HET9838033.1 PAS domain-containing protein [Candidatus Angelobacter sp.]
MTDSRTDSTKKPIRVLLLDDVHDNLILRAAILRQNGYEAITSASVEEAERLLANIDIAVLDYHLGAGKFGTEVAQSLRDKRPEVPIIILSATLERKFGGVEDMHLLKGYSSVDDLLAALRSFEAKRRGKPVVVDARDFFYSRIAMAMGEDVVLEILDRDGNWQYVNEYFARLYEKKRAWFVSKNRFEEFPELAGEWQEIIRTVADTRETYVDRSFGGLPHLPKQKDRWNWNILVFPLKLHDNRNGAVLAARVIEKK